MSDGRYAVNGKDYEPLPGTYEIRCAVCRRKTWAHVNKDGTEGILFGYCSSSCKRLGTTERTKRGYAHVIGGDGILRDANTGREINPPADLPGMPSARGPELEAVRRAVRNVRMSDHPDRATRVALLYALNAWMETGSK